MRISDWSSDVCSSDLASSAAAHWVANQTPPSTMAKTTMICPMSSLVGVMRASARTRISLCGHGPRFGDRASKRQSLSRDSRGLSGDNRAFFRSEEHTYELQSLMRISYDVVCLNKKITLNTNSDYDV